MTRFTVAAAALLSLGLLSMASATPSTEFWTAGTTDIQPYGIGHLDIDDYFHISKTSADAGVAFPTDVGYTVGILPFSKVQMEVGVDLMGSQNYPLMFNTKAAIPEDAFFKGQPAIAAGLFDIGTKKDLTNIDIGYVNIGKTLPVIGRLFVGGYTGNRVPLGGLVDKGITVAWDRSFLPAKGAGGVDYTRLTLCADLATGDNAYGGGGPGVSWNFNENICVLAGPVFFTDKDINGRWKISTQLDVNFKTW